MRVVVIGAGIVGTSVAWRIARAGARVVLCDPEPGRGATRAAAGMLAPVAETYHREEELGRLCLASARMWPAFAEQLVGDVGHERTGYRTTPTLICGTDAADRGALTDLHRLALSLDLDSRQLTTREARRLEPLLGPGVSCAFLAPSDHQADPREMSAALLEAVRALGGELVTETVEAVTHAGADDPGSPATGVRLAGGRRIGADAVVVANALGAARLEGLPIDLGPRLRPLYGDVVRLATPPHLRGMLTHTIRGLVAGHPAYLVPRGDGTVVLGATSREDANPQVSAGGVYELLRDAQRLVPAVAEFAVTETLARPRPGTPDNAPLVGSLGADGLLAATGCFRHGVLLSPAVAVGITRRLGLDDPLAPGPREDLTARPAFSPSRFDRPRKEPAS